MKTLFLAALAFSTFALNAYEGPTHKKSLSVTTPIKMVFTIKFGGDGSGGGRIDIITDDKTTHFGGDLGGGGLARAGGDMGGGGM